MVIHPPVHDTIQPAISDGIAADKIVSGVLTTFIDRPTVPHHVIRPADDMQALIDIPIVEWTVEVQSFAGGT